MADVDVGPARDGATPRNPPSLRECCSTSIRPLPSASCEHAHWMQIEQAEQMAMEWVAAWFTPTEATDWLAIHPDLTPAQARDLANAGWRPRDVRRGGDPEVWIEQPS